jgi:hypothetical protein
LFLSSVGGKSRSEGEGFCCKGRCKCSKTGGGQKLPERCGRLQKPADAG